MVYAASIYYFLLFNHIFEGNGRGCVKPQILYKNEKISAPKSTSMVNYAFKIQRADNISFTAKWKFNNISQKNIIFTKIFYRYRLLLFLIYLVYN